MSIGDKIKKGILYVLLILLGAACLFPFLLMIVNATRSGVEITRSFTLITGNSLHSIFFSTDSIWSGDVSVQRQQIDIYYYSGIYDDSRTIGVDRLLQSVYEVTSC